MYLNKRSEFAELNNIGDELYKIMLPVMLCFGKYMWLIFHLLLKFLSIIYIYLFILRSSRTSKKKNAQ
jgi:hypothetical protein